MITAFGLYFQELYFLLLSMNKNNKLLIIINIVSVTSLRSKSDLHLYIVDNIIDLVF